MDGVNECRINDIGVYGVYEFVGLDLRFSFCTLHFPTLGKSKSFPKLDKFFPKFVRAKNSIDI